MEILTRKTFQEYLTQIIIHNHYAYFEKEQLEYSINLRFEDKQKIFQMRI